MKILIVEDDVTSCYLIKEMLKEYGSTHIAVNGMEAVQAVEIALKKGEPFNLVCMDIMMPEMDGQTAVRQIRAMEENHGIATTNSTKIIMTTALDDDDSIGTAQANLCDGYMVKPIHKKQLLLELQKLGLV